METFIESLLCPITYEIMKEPVQFPCCGNTCDKSSFINSKLNTCPWCRKYTIISQLVPNRIVAGQIEEYIKNQASTNSTNIYKPFIDETTFLLAKMEKKDNIYNINCTIVPPRQGERQGICMFIGIDGSGSMNINVCEMNESNNKTFTRLDLTKHTLRTIINVLTENDTLCIIRFSDYASIALMPTFMTQKGKKKAEDAIKLIKADGGTNMWDCLRLMNKIASNKEFNNCNIVSALLTDGEANIHPPRGEVESFKLLTRIGTLNTFGFGYSLDSKLLVDIAKIGNGSFAFIPDYSMVGTVFINWLATILSSCSKNRTIQIKFTNDNIKTIQTGLIQYSQPLNYMITSEIEPIQINFIDEPPVSITTCKLLDYDYFRYDMVNYIKDCIGHSGINKYVEFYNKYNTNSDSNIKAILQDFEPEGNDNEGQMSLATKYWGKWGKHYSRAYLMAHENQICMNFKDPGLQIYGGLLFKKLQLEAEIIFCNMSALEPTGVLNNTSTNILVPSTVSTAPVTNITNTFYNAGGGCWAPNTYVRMSDNTLMLIQNIQPNMKVWTPNGPALVEYVVVLGTKKSTQLMCKLGKLWITPWHPVLINNEWRHPDSISDIVDINMPIVYNLVLDKNHIIEVDGILSVTLGHGFNGPIVSHSFFGSKENVLRDLSKQNGYDKGRPIFTDLKVLKNNDGLISGWYDNI